MMGQRPPTYGPRISRAAYYDNLVANSLSWVAHWQKIGNHPDEVATYQERAEFWRAKADAEFAAGN